jgi:hypothetical protein
MVMKANNKVETDGEDQKKKILSLEDDVCVEYSVEGEALVVRRTLNMHVKVNDSEGQMENIFHIRCHVHNKVCSLIIDGGSCINIASIELVRKLNLYATKHLMPYKLQMLNDGGEVKVNK